MTNKQFWKWKIILGVGFALAASAGFYYYLKLRAPYTISDLDAERDINDMHALFEKDWYWLSAREHNKKLLDWMIRSGSPNEFEPRYYGKMKWKILREKDGSFVGFVSYYMLNFRDGKILFLAVHPDFRGKRYAARLLDTAIEDLKSQGAQVVKLVTWQNNKSSRALYERYGFKNVKEDDQNYVFYEFDTLKP